MTKLELGERLKQFAIGVGKLVLSLQYNVINKNYGDQLIRCSSNSAAMYRAALRTQPIEDLNNKLKIVEEGLNESIFFLELIQEFNYPFTTKIDVLSNECKELLAIIIKNGNSTTRRKSNTISNIKL